MSTQQQRQFREPSAKQAGVFFGIPLGELGLVSSVLMACTLGFLSFFLLTFLSIVGISIYNGMGHHMDLAASYKWISLPISCLVLLASLIFFATLWLRRKATGG